MKIMKIILALFLLFGLTVFTNAQKITLTGIVYDEKGGRIINAKVVLIDKDAAEYKVNVDEEGSYKIKLPLGMYKITFISNPFMPLVLNKYIIVNTDSKKMSLDAVLEVPKYSPIE